MSVFRKLASLGYWLLDSEKSVSDFRKKAVWREEDLIVETSSDKILSPLVITAHVFYPEFATQLVDALKRLPKETKLFATTTSQEIKKKLESHLRVAGIQHDIRLTPNIGRNFGPLLVEFSKMLLQEEHFIHVHSKRSPHSPKIAKDWLTRNMSLLTEREGLIRIFSIFCHDTKLGLAFVDSSDMFWGINFRWGRSKRAASRALTGLRWFESIEKSGRISFPAGGMFFAKTEAIRPLLEFDWDYKIFPVETEQMDGSLQHAVERLIGQLALSRKFKHAVFFPAINRFVKIEPRQRQTTEK